MRALLRQAQFQRYGLNFNPLPNYPDELVNPRSQVFTIGAEHEILKGCSSVPITFTAPDRHRPTVDLNAPSTFDRTAAGQCRVAAAITQRT